MTEAHRPRLLRLRLIASLCLCVWLYPVTGHAAPPSKKCKGLEGRDIIYGIGSSMMGSDLGPMLKRRLKEQGHTFRKWGKASSGLARPDFHDWPAKGGSVARKLKPKVFVVALGTNDYQAIRKGRRWIKFGTEQWKEEYAKRIDTMLAILSGKKRRRAVIWMGPIAFEGKMSERRGPMVNALMRDRVNAFDGPVFFVDGYQKTIQKNGRPVRFFRHPKKGKTVKARASDNIHLSTQAVHWLIANPILEAINRCIPPKKTEPKS